MTLPYQRIHVVINPASGQDQAILNVLNDVFHKAGVEWDISITHKGGHVPARPEQQHDQVWTWWQPMAAMAPKWRWPMACWEPGSPRPFFPVGPETQWRMSSISHSTCEGRHN